MKQKSFIFGGGGKYSTPEIELLTTPVECGFQGSTFLENGSSSSKSIADPDVVTLDSW